MATKKSEAFFQQTNVQEQVKPLKWRKVMRSKRSRKIMDLQNRDQYNSVKCTDTRHNQIPTGVYAWIIICILPVLIAGCETSSTSDLTVTPASVTLDASSVSVTEFTASGGTSNYTWSLSDDSLGTLYTADATALYQNTTNIGTNTLTLTDGSNSVYATIRQR